MKKSEWEKQMNTKQQNNKVKEGKLYHSAELCSYVSNTSALMFLLLIKMIDRDNLVAGYW